MAAIWAISYYANFQFRTLGMGGYLIIDKLLHYAGSR